MFVVIVAVLKSLCINFYLSSLQTFELQQSCSGTFLYKLFLVLIPSQILTCGSSGSVSNSPERFSPRRPLTPFVVLKPCLVLRSNPTQTLMLLSAKRQTLPTIHPAHARWARPLTRWRWLTQTHAFWAWRSFVWSTPRSCPALSVETWMLQPSWWQRRLLILSEVALHSLNRGFLCTSLQHLTHRDKERGVQLICELEKSLNRVSY